MKNMRRPHKDALKRTRETDSEESHDSHVEV